jgi:hypothetical protein
LYSVKNEGKKECITHKWAACLALSAFLGCAEAQSVSLNMPIVGRNYGSKGTIAEEQQKKGILVSLRTVDPLRLINGEKHERVIIFRFWK